MKFTETILSGAYCIEMERHTDARGFFSRQFCSREFSEYGLPTQFVQINDSLNTHQYTFRGMHYRLAPHADTKIVRCLRGALLDIIIDLRPTSPTFKQWTSQELTADNYRMLLVPKGFAHGFLTLTDNTEILYVVDEFHTPHAERGLRWDDPEFDITLPHPPAVISERDANWQLFNPAYHLDQQ